MSDLIDELKKKTGTSKYFDLPEVKKLINYIANCERKADDYDGRSMAIWYSTEIPIELSAVMAGRQITPPECKILAEKSREYRAKAEKAKKSFISDYVYVVGLYLRQRKTDTAKANTAITTAKSRAFNFDNFDLYD